jgi:hypothetical protein
LRPRLAAGLGIASDRQSDHILKNPAIARSDYFKSGPVET